MTFVSPLLGTVPKNKEIYRDYIQSKAAELVESGELSEEELEQELETIESMEEKGWTGFHIIDGSPHLMSYMLTGFMAEACYNLRRDSDTKSSKIRAYKKIIRGNVFVRPRYIALQTPGDSIELDVLERPLRAQTPQGERVALVRSDVCPEGTVVKFTVYTIGDDVTLDVLKEWLDFGVWRGMGQWRNADYGLFEYEIETLK
jgi:hypothetical protein